MEVSDVSAHLDADRKQQVTEYDPGVLMRIGG